MEKMYSESLCIRQKYIKLNKQSFLIFDMPIWYGFIDDQY